jgi:DnaK suppressor protein
MDGHTIEQIRELLINRRRKLPSGSVDESESQSEMMDMAQSLEQSGRDASLVERERKELIAVERALSRLASGTFGSCEECGEDIPRGRLLALPEARLCTQCQAYEEKLQSSLRASGAAAR